ncbi:MAG: porin family protein [Dysgonamonadaceae bacterium]|nr:porin family protein [Dysgonamonadaceae bacterium]
MKTIFRKTAIIAIALVTMSAATSAQGKGDMAAGGNLVLGTGDSFTNFGIGGKFQYNVTHPVRLEGSFTCFMKKDYITMWDLSVNGHWLFPVHNRMTVYPLTGLGILNHGYDNSVNLGGPGSRGSKSDFAFNLGGGVDCRMTDNLVFNAELKYKISDVWSRFLISAGLAYRF